MSIDLLALLQEKVGGALNNFASSQLGESPSMASKAVSQILPALLGKLAGQTGDASRMTQLFNLVTGPQVDSTLVDIEPSLLDKGRQWLSLLFGDSAGLTNLLAGRTGLSADKTGTLMAAALPMLLGVLRSQVQTGKLTQPQFVSLLSGQRGVLDRVLGSDLATALGLGAVAAAAPVAAEARPAAAPVTPPPVRAVTPASASGGWMKWLWLALAALAALLLLKFCGQKPVDTTAPASAASAESVVVAPAEPASVPASEPAVVAPMASEPAMPATTAASETGAAMTADTTASAAATTDLAADASAVKYENEVLSFYFATGKTDVDKMAADAVSADIVALGKEGKTLVVSGYNDPRGNKAMNEELSKNRAKAVKAYLVEQGVPEGKIELRKPTETDGQSGSLAQDRRVDVKAE